MGFGGDGGGVSKTKLKLKTEGPPTRGPTANAARRNSHFISTHPKQNYTIGQLVYFQLIIKLIIIIIIFSGPHTSPKIQGNKEREVENLTSRNKTQQSPSNNHADVDRTLFLISIG